MFFCQTQKIVFVFSICVTSFSHSDHPQAFKYMILELKVKCMYIFVVVDGSMYVSFNTLCMLSRSEGFSSIKDSSLKILNYPNTEAENSRWCHQIKNALLISDIRTGESHSCHSPCKPFSPRSPLTPLKPSRPGIPSSPGGPVIVSPGNPFSPIAPTEPETPGLPC